jgi:antitoxin CptB
MDDRRMDRLRWRCRRGLLELDLTLQNFLMRDYPNLTAVEQAAFEKLLAISDDTLLAYVQGNLIPPENELMQLISKIRK